MNVNTWQDGVMNDSDGPPAGDRGPAQVIYDAATLRALADPLRLRILSILMERHDGALPVMSVKELAADLGEPQTKLYRHIKHLEAAGLIKAVSSRVVSGIVEQRYQAGQTDLLLGSTPKQRQMSPEAEAAAEAVTTAALELYRAQYFAASRSRMASSGAQDAPEQEPHRQTFMSLHVGRISPAHAVEIRERLQQVLNDLNEAESKAATDDAGTVRVSVLLGYFSPDPGTSR